MPRRHNLNEYLVAYLDGTGVRDDLKGPLFRTIGRGTGKLTPTVLPQANAYAMIRRRAAPIALPFTVRQSHRAKFAGHLLITPVERRFCVDTVLAVFAHPDDAELTCFGTLGLLKSRGYRVLVGIITDGLAALDPARAT